MTEPVEWRADGTPLPPDLGLPHAEAGAVAPSRQVFLQGCGLPEAWQEQPHWVILETGFGLGQNFLCSWQAWRECPTRPRRLHFVSIEARPVAAADLLRGCAQSPELRPLAEQLASQWWGLAPGFHRLEFEAGQVVLTLCIGDLRATLRELQLQADSVFLDGFDPAHAPEMGSPSMLKGVARLCRRGARLAAWTTARPLCDALRSLGFEARKTPGPLPGRDSLQASYQPAWEPRRPAPLTPPWPAGAPRRCVVIGAGLAGAGTAFALARRGWQVCLLDAADTPAQGASGLPAGLFSTHVSPDDGRIAHLTRSGLRLTREWARRLLREGVDWGASGVLEHRLRSKAGPRSSPADADMGWTEEADAVLKAGAGLPSEAPVTWHRHAGWIRPAALVRALLASQGPAIEWRGASPVADLQAGPDGWHVRGPQGQLLAQAALVVVAAGPGSVALARPALPLQPIRGQLSWAPVQAGEQLPARPVNGRGSFIPGLPGPDGLPAWYTGSTFDRHHPLPPPGQRPPCRPEDHEQNLAKLAELLPATAASLRSTAPESGLQAWSGTRCTAPDRVPLVGPLDADPAARPGLWLCTALGTRGLTWGMLCGELLACELEGEPLPVELSHARALLAARAAPGRPDSGADE